MTLEEILGDNLYKQVTAALKGKGKDGKDVNLIVNDGNYIPKEKFDSVNTQKNDLAKQIAERDKQLKELQGKATGNEELQNQIKTLQEQNKKAQKNYESKIKDMKLDSAIKAKLSENKAKYVDLLSSKFDKSKLIVAEDGTISGLDDQMKALKDTYKDLFTPVVVGKSPIDSGKSSKTYSMEEIGKMSPDEINQHWAEISKSMK